MINIFIKKIYLILELNFEIYFIYLFILHIIYFIYLIFLYDNYTLLENAFILMYVIKDIILNNFFYKLIDGLL